MDNETLSFVLIVGGVALMIAEAVAPGAHLIVLGVALFVAGMIGMFAPAYLGLNEPMSLALLVIGTGAVALYVYRRFDFYGNKGIDQTSDSASLAGRTGRVTERVTETEGEIKIDSGGFNPYYRARAEHGAIEAGTEVVVVDPGGGNVVTVRPANGDGSDDDRDA